MNVLTYRVIYGDCDPMGIVYNANYLRLFEAGRNEYCRQQGVTYRTIEGAGRFFPLTEAHVRFQRPARYDDLLILHTWLSCRTRVRLEFSYELWRDAELLVTGTTQHACVNAAGRPMRMPEDMAERFPVEVRGQPSPPPPQP